MRVADPLSTWWRGVRGEVPQKKTTPSLESQNHPVLLLGILEGIYPHTEAFI